jgi:ABC-2 type transport system ATP-binding protein
MAKEVAIKIDGVYKDFYLPKEKSNSIKSTIVNGFRKKDKSVDTQHALRDISFEINKGEFFGIVGRNGSGKSTLLKILAEIYTPSKGKVSTNGRLVPFIELGVGFNPELTGRENVFLNGALLGFSKSEMDERYDEIVKFAELEAFMDQKLKNYSSGMQVRLAFSVATRAEADILLVDEVLAVGDADFQRKCFQYFRELKKNKKTVVFVSHDMGAIREYCDKAVLIEKSKIVKSGRVSDVAAAYTKLFIPEIELVHSGDKVDTSRWGTKKIQYKSIKIIPEIVTAETRDVEIELKYECNEDINNPIFGFSVRNGGGVSITGTNTRISKNEVYKVSKGDKGVLSWKIPNIFNEGNYVIDVAVSNSDETEHFDWWENAATFDVYREQHTSYVVEPKVTFTISR